MDNTEDERIAQLMRQQDAIIDRVGWAVVSIMPQDPDEPTVFAYTVGLTAHHYPELIIAALPPHIAHSLINNMAGRVYDQARRFHHGERITDLIAGYDAVIVDGDATDVLLPGAANAATEPTRSGCNRSSGPTRNPATRGTTATASTRGGSRSSPSRSR